MPRESDDTIALGEAFHFVRATVPRGVPKKLQSHPAFVLAWVQNGQVVLHLDSGKTTLTEGDVVFLRPNDRHGFQGRGDEPLLTAVMIRPEDLKELSDSFPTLRGQFFWSSSADPDRASRDIPQLAALSQAALQLERGTRDRLALHAFLLPLLRDLLDARPDVSEDTPDWLVQAIVAARNPAVFRDGAAGFVKITGRAHPHVSRTARKYLGQSPSEYVNTIRMQHAARQLSSSNDPLAEIAEGCGIANLSHFHRLFRGTYGMTPAQFRAQHQRDVIRRG